MPFQKGHKLSTGRPVGSRSLKTEHWERFAAWLTSTNMENLEAEMKKLKGKDLVMCTIKLMEYFKPKLSRKIDENGNDIQTTITVNIKRFDKE